jgi:hypothetical protein
MPGCCEGNRKDPRYWKVGQTGGTISPDFSEPRVMPGANQPGNRRNGQPKVGITAGYQAGRLVPPLTAQQIQFTVPGIR